MTSRYTNRFAIARFATGIFFPQRLALKIVGRSYSPKVLETAMFCAARDPAYKLAAETLRETAEIQISARHLRNLAVQVGGELQAARNIKTEARMMEAEADSRGFFAAQKSAFVSDGLQYNWTIQNRHFPGFIPILDFPMRLSERMRLPVRYAPIRTKHGHVM